MAALLPSELKYTMRISAVLELSAVIRPSAPTPKRLWQIDLARAERFLKLLPRLSIIMKSFPLPCSFQNSMKTLPKYFYFNMTPPISKSISFIFLSRQKYKGAYSVLILRLI
jgi:hypothetical protein